MRQSKISARRLVKSLEENEISRNVLIWLNKCPEIPEAVLSVNPMIPISFEYLYNNRPCMALSTIQSTYITRQYIGGDYLAEYQFKIIYRGQPSSDGERLKMDEILDSIGDWASDRFNKPDIGSWKQVQRVIVNARSSLFGRYENGDEDHQILMTMKYYNERG